MEYADIFIPVAEHLQRQRVLRDVQAHGDIKFAVRGFDMEWLRGMRVALCGLRTAGVPHCFDGLRSALYSLYMPSNVGVIDLGDIEIVGGNAEENTERVAMALQRIVDGGVFPLLFAENIRYSYWLYEALKVVRCPLSVAYITPTANVGNASEPLTEQNYVGHILSDLGRELSHLSVLGYQIYLTNFNDSQLLRDSYCEAMRLSAVRSDMGCGEAVLRDATLLCVDVSAVRQCDAPAALCPTPNGLYTEEVCQLVHSAGFSNELLACFVGGFSFGKDVGRQTAMLVGQMLWHIIDGVGNRVREHPLGGCSNCVTISVEMGEENQVIVFYRGKITQRWWMEIPCGGGLPCCIVACTELDYEQAARGEVPERWLWFFKKFN